jgi:hypothetical protein
MSLFLYACETYRAVLPVLICLRDVWGSTTCSYMPAGRVGQHYLFLPYVILIVHPSRVMRPFYHDNPIKSRIGNISVLMSLTGLYMTVPV